jgi:MFS family permease
VHASQNESDFKMTNRGTNEEVPPPSASQPMDDKSGKSPTAVGTKRLLAMMMLIIICCIVVADVQGVALSPLVGTIAAEFNLQNSEVGWIITCYTLIGAAFSGLLSRLGDVFGPKRVLTPVLIAALLGTAISALATSLEILVIGRMLLGFSVPAVALIFGLVRPIASARQARLMTFGTGAAAACGVSLSFLLGGLFVLNGVAWQTLFWVCAGFLTAALVLLAATPDAAAGRRVRVPLDLVGGLGLGVWLTFILLALTYGPVDGWTSPRVLAFVLVGLVVLAGWIVQQMKNPNRLMAFRRKDLRQMLSGYSSVWLASYIAPSILLIVLPALLQTPPETGYGFGQSLLGSVLPLVLFAPGGLLAMFTLPTLIDKFGPRVILTIGGIGVAVAFFGLAFAADSYAIVFLWVFVYAYSAHLLQLGGNSLTTASGRQDNISVTIGLQYASGNIVSSVAVAVVLAFFIPNAAGLIPEGVFTTAFIGGGSVVLIGAIALFLFVPRRFDDRHAIPATTSVTVVNRK